MSSPPNTDLEQPVVPVPLLHSVIDAGVQLGLGRSTVYELIAAGAIGTVRIGRRTLVPHEALQAYVAGLEPNVPVGAA